MVPQNNAALIVAMAQVILGYSIMAALVSIFVRKIMSQGKFYTNTYQYLSTYN
jgi:hypothetical protein